MTTNDMLKRATDCRLRAEATDQPIVKATLFKAAAAWISLARQHGRADACVEAPSTRAVNIHPARYPI